MSSWLASLEVMFEKVWDQLEIGARSGLQVGFATVSRDNLPEVRTVVMRKADRANGLLEAYTDAQSAKIKSLQANPHAAILHWDPELKLQIRLQAKVTIKTGATVAALWDAVPKHSRSSYGVTPPPGSVIDGPAAYRKLSNRDQFAVMLCEVMQIDAVSLHMPHQRAVARRQPSQGGDWVTNWLAP